MITSYRSSGLQKMDDVLERVPRAIVGVACEAVALTSAVYAADSNTLVGKAAGVVGAAVIGGVSLAFYFQAVKRD